MESVTDQAAWLIMKDGLNKNTLKLLSPIHPLVTAKVLSVSRPVTDLLKSSLTTLNNNLLKLPLNRAQKLALGTVRVMPDALNISLGLAQTVIVSAQKQNCRADLFKAAQVEGISANLGFLLISI